MSRLYSAAVAVAAVVGFASVASAADLPTKAPVYTAAPVAVYNWNGCYVGAHAGGGWARTEFTNTADTTAFGHLNPGEGFAYTHNGFIGGGQVGCNHQINQWVLGVEGTFAGTTIKGDAADLAILNDDVFTTKINSLATVTARIGYAWNNVLLYAKGGYAGANVQFSVSDTCCVGGSPMGAGSETHLAEWLDDRHRPGIRDHAQLDHRRRVQLHRFGVGELRVGGGAGSYAFDVKTCIQEVLARVSYKFGP